MMRLTPVLRLSAAAENLKKKKGRCLLFHTLTALLDPSLDCIPDLVQEWTIRQYSCTRRVGTCPRPSCCA